MMDSDLLNGIFIIGGVVILIFLIPNVIERITISMEKKNQINRNKEEERKRNQAYEALIKKYETSDLTKTILCYICDGDYKANYPETIIIECGEIRSTLHGRTYVYDFIRNRVEPLHNNSGYWQLSSCMAMAKAINRLMGEEYKIYKVSGVVQMTLKSKIDF